MKRILVTCVALMMVGCTANRPPAPPLVPVAVREEPRPEPVAPPQTISFLDSLPPDVGAAYDVYLRDGKAPLIDQTKAGFVRFPYGLSQPEVRCRPFALCDIELEAGEEVLDVNPADTVRWQFQPLREGPKNNRTIHITVKPQDTIPMETGLVIGTDRRVYRINIKSSPTLHMVNVKFYYPEDMVKKFNAEQEEQAHPAEPVAAKLPSVSIEDLHQNYSIDGSASFRPVWAADDGQRTYLKMPAGVSTSGAPALYVEQNGNAELVNYTARGDYYIVHGVPSVIVLKRGVGRDAQEVTITKGN